LFLFSCIDFFENIFIRKSTSGEIGQKKTLSKQSSTESAPSNRPSRRSSSDTSGATARRSKQNSASDYPVSPVPYRRRHESGGGGIDSQDYQLVPPHQRGTSRNSAEYLHSPRGGRAGEERLAPPLHNRASTLDYPPPASRAGYHSRDNDHLSSEYLLAPPRSRGGSGGMAAGRRSPHPSGGGTDQNTLPRGGGLRSRPFSGGGGGGGRGGGRGREEEEEEELDEEGIPLVEYHHLTSPNLRVPLPDSWRTNGGGARPKQRYEVQIFENRFQQIWFLHVFL
jgi:hypothetical protein